jgi:hypothetical protein
VTVLRLLVVAVACIAIIGCTPKEVYRVQTFSPVMIDMAKIEGKDYVEIINAVNTVYAPDTKEFVDARFLKEEKMFLYFHVYSGKSSACYRVTVDRNRSKIINMQPDCPIEED